MTLPFRSRAVIQPGVLKPAADLRHRFTFAPSYNFRVSQGTPKCCKVGKSRLLLR